MAVAASPLWRVAALALGVLVASLFAPPALAQRVAAPVLRVETGAHSAAIRALDVDRGGRFAVTASDDKTARVWDLASGQLLQTLRPPAGPGNEGRLFAVAITPDATVVAAAGWSADNDVYLFERSSGHLLQRITGLPDVITQLSFSPDGSLLLVGLWGRYGVRLFASGNGWAQSAETAADARYEGDVQGASFAPDGQRLATSSADGLVRLYDLRQRKLQLLRSARTGAGLQPFGLAWSPDGRLLAVGHADNTAVAVLQADTLQAAWTAATTDLGHGSLNAVAWSADGRDLQAAGTWKRADNRHGLRRWPDQGRGKPVDQSLSGDSIVALRTLADGRTVYAATDPAWGWTGKEAGAPGAVRQSVASGLLDFRLGREAFRVARDGSAVSFGVPGGANGVLLRGFDLQAMGWTEVQPAWTGAVTSAAGIVASDWFESAAPRLNNRLLPLVDHELAMAAAASAPAGGMVLGTSAYVRFYRPDGQLLWRTAVPSVAWQVQVSGDGRWVIAALGDGTLRWYRSRDGLEMLALLPHADLRRWIAWTPQGYFAASPGGEDLFGWQVNRGASAAADFFPASRFRASYFKPQLLSELVASGELPANVAQADQPARPATAAGSGPAAAAVAQTPAVLNQQLPPVVTVSSPRDGDSFEGRDILLRVAVRTPPGAPAARLRARLDGSPFELPLAQAGAGLVSRNIVVSASADEALAGPPAFYEQRVALSPQDHELLVFAENRNGSSTPALIRLKWAGPPAARPAATPAATPAAPSATPDLRPALYVLAVGISKYKDPNIQLDFPAKDATDFANVFRRQENKLYRKVEVRLLTDAKARRDDVLDGLEWIRREMTARDVGVVLMAGHGVNDSDGVYYYLPQDVDVQSLKRSAVIFSEIRNTLASLPGKALFFIDTCHAGNVLGTGRRGLGSDITSVVNELSSAENGVIVFAASTGRQFAQESNEWGNGAFTMAVIEGMSGKADTTRTGRVTHKMLDLYVSERVKALTKGTQSPVTIVPQGVPDFPVALSR